MTGFAEGYRYFQENSPGYIGAIDGDDYIKLIINEIDKLSDDINGFKGFNTGILQLKGDVSEFWHSGTHNIDSALKGIKGRTSVDRSHDFASPDIVSDTGEKFGLKYMNNGILGAKAQAKSYFERYCEYKSLSKKDISFDEFLSKRNINPAEVLLHDSIYSGQIRVIPKDQMDVAISWLRRKVAEEGSIRPDQIARYEETLTVLKDCVKTRDGAKSISLSREDAEKLAELAKKGEFSPSKYGLTTEELISFKYIMEQSVHAGLTSATISLVLKIAPQLYKALEFLIENGEIDDKQLRKIGFSALTGFSEGFIRGTVSAALTSSCKSGILGESLKLVDPSTVGAVTVIFMNVMKNSYEIACGRMTNREMINELVKDMYVSAFALVFGGITQTAIEIPILGYLLGSFVGSMIGGITYEIGYSKLISFCTETGFTVFGLVEQDYRLPNEVIEKLGFDIYELDEFVFDEFEYDKFEYNKFQYGNFVQDKIGFVFVRRGVIGINRIGYIY